MWDIWFQIRMKAKISVVFIFKGGSKLARRPASVGCEEACFSTERVRSSSRERRTPEERAPRDDSSSSEEHRVAAVWFSPKSGAYVGVSTCSVL